MIKTAKTVAIKHFSYSGEKIADALELGEREFIGYASTWTTEPDSYGDTVVKGAFKKSLNDWARSGATIPLLYAHNMDDPFMNIGGVVEAVEDSHGLRVRCRIDEEGGTANQVWRLLKARRVKEMSFAYNIIEAERNEYGGFTLRELELLEVSVVLVGANREAQISDVSAKATGTVDATPTQDVTDGTSDTIDTTSDTTDILDTSAANRETVDNTDASTPQVNNDVESPVLSPPFAGDSTITERDDTISGESTAAEDRLAPSAPPIDTNAGAYLDAAARAKLTLLELALRGKQK